MSAGEFGIVTFSDGKEKWHRLAGVLIDSALRFTPWRVAHFTIGYEYRHDDPRVLIQPLPVADTFRRICYYKLLAGVQHPFGSALVLDADSFVGPEVVEMVQSTLPGIPEGHRFPLCSRHPFARDVDWEGNFLKAMNHLEPHLGPAPKPLMPYVHANFFVPPAARPFLERCWELCGELDRKGVEPIRADETVLNWKLAAEGCDLQLDYTFTNFAPEKVRNWLDGGPINVGVHNKTRLSGASAGVFHGEKDPARAREKLELVKRKQDGVVPRRWVVRTDDPSKVAPEQLGVGRDDVLVVWRRNPWQMPRRDLADSLRSLEPPFVWLDTTARPVESLCALPPAPDPHDLAFYGASSYNASVAASPHAGWLRVRNLHTFFAVSIGSARAQQGLVAAVREQDDPEKWTRANFASLDCYVMEKPVYYSAKKRDVPWTQGITLAAK
ncbi:MAG TPA: hypothetical protein VLW85_02515 [Myxococcales bacterium]|nr:hypothetical protein [Myxococcales bacterium]